MMKNDIRRKMLQVRAEISLNDVVEKSNRICERLILSPEFEEADCVLLYADFKNEVMTKNIFDECIRKKKKVFFPKCDDNTMTFYQVISIGELQDGMWGIKEPVNTNLPYSYNEMLNTLIVVPGVAFDVRGYRIGYGKGYYDRFLNDKQLINKVGLCFSEQLIEELPTDIHDIKMDKIVMEELVYSFLRI